MAMTTADFKSARVNFGYDQVGRLDSIFRVANQDYSTPVTTSFTSDLLDRVTAITHSKLGGAGAVTLSQFSYTYDANGRVIGSTGPEGALSFALDANGQLLSVTGSRSEAYAFDANGNRSSSTTGTGNLLLSDGQFSYTYDFEGNRKTRTRLNDGQLTEYFWDHRNQLTKALVKDANGVLLKELRFTYDVEGRRVGVWVDADGAGTADQVWTVYDGANPYMDFDGTGQLQTRYLYGPGVDELFARIGAGEDPQWYLTDRLGSVRQIVDGSGTILDDIIYDSFGNVLSESNPLQGDRFKFTGREFSPELGIYYYRARWYDPGSGRFISQDPIGFRAGDPNLYRYVGNGPGDARDPEGLLPLNEWRLDISGHGGPHIQNGNQRTAYLLTPRDIMDLKKSGVLDRINKNVNDSLVKEVFEEAKRMRKIHGLKQITKKVMKELAEEIVKKSALPLLVFFAASDYAEGGEVKVIKNIIIPGDLIEDLVTIISEEAFSRFSELWDTGDYDIFIKKLINHGFSQSEAEKFASEQLNYH
jgi:RHS repeat-associated protein